MIRRDIRSFFVWVRSSQIPLYITPIYIIAGILILGYRPYLHVYVMSFAVRLFYVGVMWGQAPGWSGAMPHKITSSLVASAEVLAAFMVLIDPWFIDLHGLSWQILLWVGSIAHAAQYFPRGLGRTMRTAPNILTVAGLLYSLTTPWTKYMGILVFPLASVLSLLLRVDPTKRKMKITVNHVLIFTLVFIVSVVAPIIVSSRDIYKLYLLPLTILFFFLPKVGGGDIYLIGTSISKIIALLSFPLSFFFSWSVSIHIALIGFLAITMASLCTPLLIPGIIWREIPKLDRSEIYFIVSLGLLSTFLRGLGGFTHLIPLVILSGLLVIILTLYYVYKILKMPKVPVVF
ncbi:MAG: hypothetical protein ACP5GI_07650 [Sulfolobales archaeon]